jgi:hypothetical protein
MIDYMFVKGLLGQDKIVSANSTCGVLFLGDYFLGQNQGAAENSKILIIA